MPTTPIPGQLAPSLSLPLIIGGRWDLSAQSPDLMSMIIVYRGLHCPICKTFLQGLRGLYDEFLEEGVEVVNVSMDTEERARQAHEEWELDPIPMAHGMTREQAEAWGLFLSSARTDAEPELFSEPGLFLVKPDGSLWAAETSSTPFLRPDLEVLAERLGFIAEKGYPPRGTAS
ncbi:peroxiredoxin family protein [uncultured Jannaschia sp.]|uniref:peroxiredoxin family protein n=1 Tax=uncultured Jannaschia sp. TaxID=293347 RepID=UPI0026250F5E|nr:peroxiredoxin family protein [uncultured Jannaschia sp.]